MKAKELKKISDHYVEVEGKMYLAKFEREEEYLCQTEKEVNNLTSD